MDDIEASFKSTAKRYNSDLPHSDACFELIQLCINRLINRADYIPFGAFRGNPSIPYNVFRLNTGVSRPIRPDLFIFDAATLVTSQQSLLSLLRTREHHWSDSNILLATRVVYTSVLSFACCIDLWKRSSRKTPGTFFEIYVASLLPFLLPTGRLSKHVPLPGLDVTDDMLSTQETSDSDSSSVATDLVISQPNSSKHVVIPLKITTRERIVQPFAHQRILDSAFGQGTYHSFLTCVSETQLDHRTLSVKQVCVPGTVKLFQKHLGQIAGLYYCDVPQRYSASDMTSCLPVQPIGSLFRDLAHFFNN